MRKQIAIIGSHENARKKNQMLNSSKNVKRITILLKYSVLRAQDNHTVEKNNMKRSAWFSFGLYRQANDENDIGDNFGNCV